MRTDGQTPTLICRRPKRASAGEAAFTLVELLVVMAIASLLTGLLVMGVRGFNGSIGRRNAISTLMGVFDQARTVAISDARPTYVAFVSTTHAQNNSDKVAATMWGRAYAIFEDPVLTDSTTSLIPQQRSSWLYLPTGFAFKCADNGDGTAKSVTAILPADATPADLTTFNVPKTSGGTATFSLPYVKFDATGQIIDSKGNLSTPTLPPLHVLIFEGATNASGAETVTRRNTAGSQSALDEIVLKPITGRARYTLNSSNNSSASN